MLSDVCLWVSNYINWMKKRMVLVYLSWMKWTTDSQNAKRHEGETSDCSARNTLLNVSGKSWWRQAHSWQPYFAFVRPVPSLNHFIRIIFASTSGALQLSLSMNTFGQGSTVRPHLTSAKFTNDNKLKNKRDNKKEYYSEWLKQILLRNEMEIFFELVSAPAGLIRCRLTILFKFSSCSYLNSTRQGRLCWLLTTLCASRHQRTAQQLW